MSLRDDVRLGDETKHIMQSESVQTALKQMRDNFISRWERTEDTQFEERELAWQMHRLIDLFEREMRILLDNGAVAAQELARLNQQEK